MSLLTYAFMRWALGAGIVSALACGLIGPFVRVRRLAFLAGAVAHSALGGLGVAYHYGFSPAAGALPAAVISAILIGWLDQKGKGQEGAGHEDAFIGAIWAVGMAIGILFISRTPGYNVQLLSYLFGSILTVGPDHLAFMTIGLAIVAAMLTLFWRPMVACSLDSEFARLRGLPVDALNYLLLVLIAVSVVLLIQVVGLILVLALLTLPSAIAAHWTRSMISMVLVSTGTALVSIFAGLEAAVKLDWPAGPVIILSAASMFGLSQLARRVIASQRNSASSSQQQLDT